MVKQTEELANQTIKIERCLLKVLLTLTAVSIWFKFKALETGTRVIAHTMMSTFP